MESAALSKADFLCREGQPEREVCVQNGVEGDAGCVGNAGQLWGVDQGIEGAGLGVVKMGKRCVLRQFGGWSGVGNLVFSGLFSWARLRKARSVVAAKSFV